MFRIDSGVRQVCIMPLWFFSAYMEVVMKEVKTEMGMRGLRFQEERREWILPGFLYVNDLVLFGESEEDLRFVKEEV